MKKFTNYFSLFITTIFCLFIFSGCENSNKALARKLDDSVTDLIYSVSSLDWVDSNILTTINNATTKNNNLTPINSLTDTNSQIEQPTIENNTMIVSYSAETIQTNTNSMQEKIKELIDSRSQLLIYVNHLYNGNINLSQENLTAINVYINIIQDNTAFLNSNRGIITNQVSQAQSIINENAYSPLINAYIIRTNEAIESRLAKLDSSILAINSICDIIKYNQNNTQSLQNLTNNTLENSNINEYQIEENQTDESNLNNNTLFLDNKCDQNNNNCCDNCNNNCCTNPNNYTNINNNENTTNENPIINNDNVLNGLYGNDTLANAPSKNSINNTENANSKIEPITNDNINTVLDEKTNNCNSCESYNNCDKNNPIVNNYNTTIDEGSVNKTLNEISHNNVNTNFIDSNYRENSKPNTSRNKNTTSNVSNVSFNNDEVGTVVNNFEQAKNMPYLTPKF